MRGLASLLALSACFGLAACSSEPQDTRTLAEARKGQDAAVTQKSGPSSPAPRPPEGTLQMVSYPAPNGDTSGYLTPPPSDGKKHPAIIWVTGGDLALGDVWSPQPADNDQTAGVFHDSGMVVFYPGLRGLNRNPGQVEGFYGEVDDLVAAANWLKTQPGVDPDRIYLGGHSSGGTLVLLAAEYGGPWKAVFSFGPVTDPAIYGDQIPVPIAADNDAGARLRKPVNWLHSVSVPTFVIEGTGQGNVDELRVLKGASDNPKLHFVEAEGCDHFSVLHPLSQVIAKAIVAGEVDSLAASSALAKGCS